MLVMGVDNSLPTIERADMHKKADRALTTPLLPFDFLRSLPETRHSLGCTNL